METTKSEDCLIFYGFSPEIIKFKQVYPSIENFIKNKRANDPSGRYNLIIFQEDGPNYLDHFTFDPDHILDTLKSLKDDIVRANVAGGIFIAITFIIDVFKKISEKVFRLLILVDEGTYEIPEEYLPPIVELIKVVKDFPFFIDIIRIGIGNSEESRKLENLAHLCNGEFHEIDQLRNLNPLLSKLSEKKYISEPSFIKSQIRMILKDNQLFYLNLADEPIILNKEATCSICFNRDDHGIVQCPSCETVAHKICWAQWAKTTNIGIPYVFRCHNCFNILKLDENFVYDVQAGKIPSIAELKKMEKKNIIEYLHELEAKEKPKIIHAKVPIGVEIKESSQKRTLQKRVIICPNCSRIIIGDKKKCPSCNFILF
ncbi:MAG: hypothetical protein ACFFB0_11145 [Promethearchaeota archaeon]